VARNGKRITLVACISADGSYLRPALIIARKTWDDELVEWGYTSEKIEVYSQEHSFIEADIFDDWFSDTFVPEIQKRRSNFGYRGLAILIMDNCTAHKGPNFEELKVSENIEILWLPPHSSNQLQMLDLVIFGVTKGHISRMNKLEKCNIQTRHIAEIVDSFMAAAVPSNIVKSFRNGGIIIRRDADNNIWCDVDPNSARCILPGPTQRAIEPEADPNIEIFQETCLRMALEATNSGVI
jgi:hypothetical protein